MRHLRKLVFHDLINTASYRTQPKQRYINSFSHIRLLSSLAADLSRRTAAFLQKYRYPALILLIGLALLALPAKQRKTAVRTEQPEPTQTTEAQTDYCAKTEENLARILSQIEGAGRVRVMLTLAEGTRTVYQTDREETVLLSRGSSYTEPAVIGAQYPTFRGALIVSEGADSPTVRYAIASAVSALLGIGTDRITVVKMK